MKICIVLPCNIYLAPFYKHYVEKFQEANVSFDLIYWNRSNVVEETHAQQNFIFTDEDKVNSGKFLKYFKYKRFASFVKKQLQINKYDRVIILSSYAGIMVFLSSFLEKNYYQKYWLDIRDFTFEHMNFYYKGMKKAIYSSKITAISSPGYTQFLPEWDYLQVHNTDLKKISKSKKTYKSDEPIRISFIGLVRYFEENQKLLLAFKNDKRFILQYYGKNSEVLQKFCNNEGILNVDFYGQFNPEDTIDFYNKTDIINNVYGNENVAEKTALSNKLYYAANNNFPILVSTNTVMEEAASGLGLGFSIDFNNKNQPDEIFNWFHSLNYVTTSYKTKVFLKQVKLDNDNFEYKLIKFITN